jgi:hypothetical protein
MDDEPLAEWAKRRDSRIGRLRARPITHGGPKGAHIAPAAPRLVERWNGHAWEFFAVAEDLAAARRILYPKTAEAGPTTRQAPSKPLGSGTGTHRKPPAPRPDQR